MSAGGWHPTFPKYVPTAGNVIQRSAAYWADRRCLVGPAGGITFGQLELRSRRLAARLVEVGVCKGDRVAFLFPNGPDWVVTWAAIVRIGAVAVPVSTFYMEAELARFLHHADVQFLVMDQKFGRHDYVQRLLAVAPELATQAAGRLRLQSHPQLRAVMVSTSAAVSWAIGGFCEDLDNGFSAVSDEVVAEMEAAVTPADPMMLMYTSGSTAEPKGVWHAHGSMTRHAVNLAAMSAWSTDHRLWTPLPFFWIGGFHNTLYRALVSGATLFTQPIFDAEEAIETFVRERITHILTWPAMAHTFIEHPSFASADLGSLIGGSVYDRIPAHLRPPDPGLVCNSLGMTETCGLYSFCTVDEEQRGVPPQYRGAFGRPVPGMDVKIVDPDSQLEMRNGGEGEIVVRGYAMMLGLHRKERHETFDPEGWYHTGDYGHLRDGWLFFTGRRSEMIKTNGSNVAPAEVESYLEALPIVRRAFVVGVPHPTRLQDAVALVVAQGEGDGGPAQIQAREIQEILRTRLSSYKVPRHVFQIGEAAVPWLATQKPDRRRLTDLATQLVANLAPDHP